MAQPRVEAAPQVIVELVNLAGDLEQIGPRDRATALLKERSADIEAAIGQASDIVNASVARLTEPEGWQVSTVTATFGLALSADASVILSKVTAAASFEVTITLNRL